MPITVEKLLHEPILVVNYIGVVKGQDVIAAQTESLVLAEGLEGPVYRINNTLPIQMDFGDMVLILSEAASQRPGSGRDTRFVDIAVADGELTRLGVQSLNQAHYGQLNIPLFEDLDSALAYARQKIS